jgi:hypothetical protein
MDCCDVISEIVFHDESFGANVAAERSDVKVNSIFVFLQGVLGTERFATNCALLFLIQTTSLTKLKKKNFYRTQSGK